MMLYIDPASVDMRRAVKEFSPSPGPLQLTRRRGAPGTYSETGVWGDPTLATRERPSDRRGARERDSRGHRSPASRNPSRTRIGAGACRRAGRPGCLSPTSRRTVAHLLTRR